MPGVILSEPACFVCADHSETEAYVVIVMYVSACWESGFLVPTDGQWCWRIETGQLLGSAWHSVLGTLLLPE